MREHLAAILDEGVVYSLPGIAVGEPAEAEGGAPLIFFQVVHAGVERQKTAGGRDCRLKGKVSVQCLQGWRREDGVGEGADEHLLCYDGDPQVLDLTKWCTDWNAWTVELRRWTQVRSGEEAHSAVRDCQPIVPVTDWRDDGITTWTVLQALGGCWVVWGGGARGWSYIDQCQGVGNHEGPGGVSVLLAVSAGTA